MVVYTATRKSIEIVIRFNGTCTCTRYRTLHVCHSKIYSVPLAVKFVPHPTSVYQVHLFDVWFLFIQSHSYQFSLHQIGLHLFPNTFSARTLARFDMVWVYSIGHEVGSTPTSRRLQLFDASFLPFQAHYNQLSLHRIDLHLFPNNFSAMNLACFYNFGCIQLAMVK